MPTTRVDPGPINPDTWLHLPPRVRFIDGLRKLEIRLRKSAVAGYTAIFGRIYEGRDPNVKDKQKYARRTAALKELRDEPDALRAALRAYLSVRIAPRFIDEMYRPVPLPFGPIVNEAQRAAIIVRNAYISQPSLLPGGVYFTSTYQGRLYGKQAAEIDKFESSMAPEISEVAFISERAMVRAGAVHQLWFHLVRASLATVIVSALPYPEIWKRLYGNAGYELSLHIEPLVTEITESYAYQAILAAAPGERWMGDYISTGFGGKGALALPLSRTLDELVRASEIWREKCGPGTCSPASRGEDFPAEFDPITLRACLSWLGVCSR